MDDATRHDAGRGDNQTPAAGSGDEVSVVVEPAPDWLDALCSIDQRHRLRELLAEGEALLTQAQRWAAAASAELSGYEADIKDHGLTEAIAHDLSRLTGVGQIHCVFEDFANLDESAVVRWEAQLGPTRHPHSPLKSEAPL
jgi:hypothetical protein